MKNDNAKCKMVKIPFALILVVTLFLEIAYAANMSSENFSVEGGDFNSGGTIDSASNNFSLNASFGEAIIGDSTSDNFQAETGFQKVIRIVTALLGIAPEPVAATTPSGGGGGIIDAASLPSHVNAFSVPLTIEPVQSGTLTQRLSDGKEVIVEIQRNSVSSQTTIIVREEILSGSVEPLLTIGAILIGDAAFSITAQDVQGNPVHAFSQDITITLTIPELLVGKADLGLYFLDDVANEWILMPDAVFSDDKVIFKVNHLITLFAIFRVAGLPPTLPVAPEVSVITIQILPLPSFPPSIPPEDIEIKEEAAVGIALPLFDILVEPTIELPGGRKITPVVVVAAGLVVITAFYLIYRRIKRFIIKRKIDQLKK